MVRREGERVRRHALKARPARIRPDETHQLGPAADENEPVVVSVFRKETPQFQIPDQSAAPMGIEEMDLILQKIAVFQRKSQEEFRQFKAEVRMIVQSNDRTIQAILDQTATDRLKRDEERIEHERRMQLLEANNQILASTQQGVAALLGSIDEDRPTVLRKLNSIEQKTDSILDRLSPN